MSNKITINNPFRSRSFGFGYCAHARADGRIEPTDSPIHVGTVNRVRHAIAADRTYQSFRSGGVFFSGGWFYRGKKILSVEGLDFEEWLIEMDFEASEGETMPSQITIEVQV